MFRVYIEVAHPEQCRFEPVLALIDTGATYAVLPPYLLNRLGITPTDRGLFQFANGETLEGDVGEARFRIGGRERTSQVGFGFQNDVFIIGAHTLESFGLIADTTQHRLVPARLLLVGIRVGIVPGVPMPYEPTV